MKLFYDEKKEHGVVFRKMWNDIFKDPDPYEEFYFRYVYPKNQVLALEKDHEIAGMIHLNPYQLSVAGQSMSLHYIVGVATREQYRRQGVMRRMLVACMNDMAEQGESFTYLMPADKAYYTPFDFVTVQHFETQTKDGKDGDSQITVLLEEEYEAACEFVNRFCAEVYKVYTVFDPDYLRQLHQEVLCENGELLVWKDATGIRGFCCYDREDDHVYIRQFFCREKERMMEELKSYFPGTKMEFTVCGTKEKESAAIMVRILRLDLLTEVICGKKKQEFTIRVEDSILEHQNGTFRFVLDPAGCRIERTEEKTKKSIAIRDLTRILFGCASPELLEAYPEFMDLEPLAPVMIGEII